METKISLILHKLTYKLDNALSPTSIIQSKAGESQAFAWRIILSSYSQVLTETISTTLLTLIWYQSPSSTTKKLSRTHTFEASRNNSSTTNHNSSTINSKRTSSTWSYLRWRYASNICTPTSKCHWVSKDYKEKYVLIIFPREVSTSSTYLKTKTNNFPSIVLRAPKISILKYFSKLLCCIWSLVKLYCLSSPSVNNKNSFLGWSRWLSIIVLIIWKK